MNQKVVLHNSFDKEIHNNMIVRWIKTFLAPYEVENMTVLPDARRLCVWIIFTPHTMSGYWQVSPRLCYVSWWLIYSSYHDRIERIVIVFTPHTTSGYWQVSQRSMDEIKLPPLRFFPQGYTPTFSKGTKKSESFTCLLKVV